MMCIGIDYMRRTVGFIFGIFFIWIFLIWTYMVQSFATTQIVKRSSQQAMCKNIEFLERIPLTELEMMLGTLKGFWVINQKLLSYVACQNERFLRIYNFKERFTVPLFFLFVAQFI
eukprot:TRINITY_DN32177_c0_g1_i2.p1 TRINITY_DN32177_c0_g1~~TRINITY_DN32177_c0_g1_i2.p1  ORF type:complete len:116 (+),score=2.90 TRINITY_DN32177_c0_g1_i2:108-455(+)